MIILIGVGGTNWIDAIRGQLGDKDLEEISNLLLEPARALEANCHFSAADGNDGHVTSSGTQLEQVKFYRPTIKASHTHRGLRGRMVLSL